jgi:3-hydroxyisobutyrate dehydrogenase
VKTAATPRKAAEDNNFVIAMISDDGESRRVWREAEDGALGGMKADVIAIESSTLTPA